MELRHSQGDRNENLFPSPAVGLATMGAAWAQDISAQDFVNQAASEGKLPGLFHDAHHASYSGESSNGRKPQ
jgi:hypothetical protein